MPLPDTVYNINGFLSPAEAELLYRLASEVQPGGRIVEIGSYQGRSTVCLGLGAKVAGAWVWAVDPFDDYWVNQETHYCMEHHAALLKNLVDFDVADVVRVVALDSMSVAHKITDIDLLWIDGSHEYADVGDDLTVWAQYVSDGGKIALHDSSGHFPSVTQAMQDFIVAYHWKITEQVDATSVLERV